MSHAGLELMLMKSARLAVNIRRTYTKVKKDPSAYYYTYVLLLQDNKMYIGATDNIYNRLLHHCQMSKSSSVWVRQHGPVKRVVEITRNCDREDETLKTMEYMTMFGWKNVRGAAYCRSALRGPPPQLVDFRKDGKLFDYLTRREIDDVVSTVRDLAEMQDAMSDGGSDAGSTGAATDGQKQ